MSERWVRTADVRAPRDPRTGLLLGAEPLDLGPENAPRAALLVHGYLGAGNNFGELPARLASSGWRVRVMRLPGHGSSPRDLLGVTAGELEDSVLAETRRLQATTDAVVLVGHSMGGALCAITAAREPVAGLVLAAPCFGITHHWYYGLAPGTWARLLNPVVPWVYKGRRWVQVNRKEAKNAVVSYRWVPVRSVMTLTEVVRRANAPGLLEQIACPVLLLHSSQDEAAAPEAARRAFDRIEDSRKRAVWLETSNHVLFWDYERERATDEVCRFLDTL